MLKLLLAFILIGQPTPELFLVNDSPAHHRVWVQTNCRDGWPVMPIRQDFTSYHHTILNFYHANDCLSHPAKYIAFWFNIENPRIECGWEYMPTNAIYHYYKGPDPTDPYPILWLFHGFSNHCWNSIDGKSMVWVGGHE